MQELAEKLIIRNAILKVDDYIFIAAVIVLSYLLWGVQDTSLIWFLLPFVLFNFYSIAKRIRKRDPQIIIDEVGIHLCIEKEIYEWDKVLYSYVKPEIVGMGKHARSVDYLYIFTSDTREIKKKIDDYQYSLKEVADKIEYFSGRKIGEYNDHLKGEFDEILNGQIDSSQIMNLFKDQQISYPIYPTIILIAFMMLSVYLQYTIDFCYSIAFGFVISISLGVYQSKRVEENFRKREPVSKLTEEQYHKIAMKYQLRYSDSNSRIFKLVVSILAIGIFIFSYFACISMT